MRVLSAAYPITGITAAARPYFVESAEAVADTGDDVPLTRDEVLHVARLARVGLTEADVSKFQQQLSQILDHFDVLRRVPTDDVPPTTHTLPLEGVMAPDEPRPSLNQPEVLANAPLEQDGYLRVRAVLEE
jgi:aspartyl-tRNA(Asn)/glutamyl-tRNA(Gln) amidotransferase subunit C